MRIMCDPMRRICCFAAIALVASVAFGQQPAPPAFPDMTGDDRVDVRDLWLLVPQWHSYGIADLNSDGVIEREDLGLLRKNWHDPPPTPTPLPPTPTPHPDVGSIATHTVAEGVIGPTGGSLAVPVSSDALSGTTVLFPPGSLNEDRTISLVSVPERSIDVDEEACLGIIGVLFQDGAVPVSSQLDPWIVVMPLLEERRRGEVLFVKEYDPSTGEFSETSLLSGSDTVGITIEGNRGVFAVDHPGIFALFGAYANNESEPVLQIGGLVEHWTWSIGGERGERKFGYPPFINDRHFQNGRSLSMHSWQRHAWKEALKELLLNTDFAVIPRYFAVDEVFSRIGAYENVMGVIQALAEQEPQIHLLWELGDLPPSFTETEITAENALAVRETLRALFGSALERRAVQNRLFALQSLVQGTWLESDLPFQEGLDDALFEVTLFWDDNWEAVYSSIEDASLADTPYDVGFAFGQPFVGRSLFSRFLGISRAAAEDHTVRFGKSYAPVKSSLGAMERAAMLSCLATLDRVAFADVAVTEYLEGNPPDDLDEIERIKELLRLYSARMYYGNYSILLTNEIVSANVLSPLFKTILESESPGWEDLWTELQGAASSYAEERVEEVESAYEVASGVPERPQYFAGGTWRLTQADTLPAGVGATTVYDSVRGQVVLFGGQYAAPPPGGYLWEWFGTDWQSIGCACPPARWGHAMAYDSQRSKAVLFGGRAHSGNVCYSDTWEWDGENWTATGATGPAGRWGHAMAYDEARGKVVMFGGQPRDFNRFFGDTWEWDGERWVLAAETGPPARVGAAMSYDPVREKVILFGGGENWDWFGDTWEWDGHEWNKIDTLGPSPRSNHRMVLDTERKRIVLFGGLASETVNGNSIVEKRLHDTWEWDGVLWREVTPDGPQGRYCHTMAYDGRRNAVLLFGGIGSQPYGDTWLYRVEE